MSPMWTITTRLVRRENFGVFIIFIEKYIDQLETKLADIDPSIVGQHARPLKNNYSKAYFALICRYFETILYYT